jgi:hypothetical protein
MTRGILIAGNESALSVAVEAETAGRVERYAAALIPDRFSGETPPAKPAADVSPARIPMDWNPGNPVSARTLVLGAENRLGRVDEAILICDPPSVRRPGANFGLADLGLSDIEILVNDHIKGWFYLVKELAAVFKARGEGTLALVFPEGKTDKKDAASGADSDLLGPAALAAFRSLAGGLLAAAPDEPYLTLGFSGAAAGDEAGFAAFILKNLDEPRTEGRQGRGSPLLEGNRRGNGKLYKYGKTGFFR